MKVSKVVFQCNMLFGDSYRIITDGEYDYQIFPDSNHSIFAGMIKKTAESTYIRGLQLQFASKDPFSGHYISSANEVAISMVKFAERNPDKFEKVFAKYAKSAQSKKARYPRMPKNGFKY